MAAVVVLTIAACALGFSQLRAISRIPSARLNGLLRRMRPMSSEARFGCLQTETEATSWEGQLGRALAQDASPAARTDALSEAVNDIAVLYASKNQWSAGALRIQILGGILASAVAMIGADFLAAAGALLVTVAGAALISTFGRRARQTERAQRRDVDDLVQLLAPESCATAAGRQSLADRRPAPGRSRLDRQSSAM